MMTPAARRSGPPQIWALRGGKFRAQVRRIAHMAWRCTGQWTVLFLLAMAGQVSGCAGPRLSTPAVDATKLSDEAFQAYLAEIELVTVDEAYRAMLILADGEDPSKGFEQRRAILEGRGIARAAWQLQPDHVVDAGSVAYMVCRICRISGGINMRLFGASGLGDRRYALRELIAREMIQDVVDYQFMTGAAMFAILRRADTLMQEKGLYESQGIDLSDETDRDEHGDLIVPPPVEQSSPDAG